MQFRSNICALVTRETFNSETSESLNAETRLDVSQGSSFQDPRPGISSGTLSKNSLESLDRLNTVQASNASRIERQRKLILYDVKKNKAVLQFRFASKIISLEMNYSHILAATKD